MPTRSTATLPPKTAPNRRNMAPAVPFTAGQQAVLQLLNRPLSDAQLADLQRLISNYLASQTDALAQQAWQERGYTQADMDALLDSHVRTPYKKP
jgi:hypothetical protein